MLLDILYVVLAVIMLPIAVVPMLIFLGVDVSPERLARLKLSYRRWYRRHRVQFAVPFLALLVMAAGLAVYTFWRLPTRFESWVMIALVAMGFLLLRTTSGGRVLLRVAKR